MSGEGSIPDWEEVYQPDDKRRDWQAGAEWKGVRGRERVRAKVWNALFGRGEGHLHVEVEVE